MRINRFLASAGLGSRRGVESLVRDGRVTVNGRVVTDLSTDIGEKDAVKVNNKLVQQKAHLYVLLNKPRGYLCTASDEKDRRTIYELLPKSWPNLAHVGRLDKESDGLLILTNDGDLALHLTHPRYKVDKCYEVVLDKDYDMVHTEKLLHGFMIEGGRAKVESAELVGRRTLHVVLRQGIKRQIRLMFYELGYEVERLTRKRIGPITDAGLSTGDWRMLAKREVDWLIHPETAPQVKLATPRYVPKVRRQPQRDSGPRPSRKHERKYEGERSPESHREERKESGHRGPRSGTGKGRTGSGPRGSARSFGKRPSRGTGRGARSR